MSTPEGQQGMLIGQLADTVGVTAKTIRFYEQVGILPSPPRSASGYRRYGPEDVDRLRFVRRAQDFGLHLHEIREIVALRDNGRFPSGSVRESVRKRVDNFEARIEELRRTCSELREILVAAGERPPP